MVKLLDYKTRDDSVILFFEKLQWVKFHKFGLDILTTTSNGIGKDVVKEIKKKVATNGFKCNLDEFVENEFKEYFEL